MTKSVVSFFEDFLENFIFLYSAESANFYFLLLFLYLLFLVLSFHFDKILNSSKIFPYVPVKANIDKRIEDFLFAIFGKTTEF